MNKVNNTKRAAIYVNRISENHRATSIDEQIQATQEYAEQNGLNVVNVYQDDVVQSSAEKRLGFEDMISAAKGKLFDVVIVYKLDRFAVDKSDATYYKRLLRKNNVRLLSVTEHLDDNPELMIMEALLDGLMESLKRNLTVEDYKAEWENEVR